MRVRDLMYHCLAKKEGSQWVAINLELDLAVQGRNLREVKDKLAKQTAIYLREALAGEDREHATYLLKRRAPWYMFAQWHWYHTVGRIDHVVRNAKAFCAPIPMTPQVVSA